MKDPSKTNGHKPKHRSPVEQQEGESDQAFRAFRVYFEMGEKRSLMLVAQRVSKSLPLMKRWSRRWKWPSRIREYTKSLTVTIDKKSKSQAIARRLPDIMGITEILARTSFLARATLDDVLDEQGKFDIVKARKTGGIHTIKTVHFHQDGATIKSITLRDHNHSLDLMGRHFQIWNDEEDPDEEARRLLREEEERKRLAVDGTPENPLQGER